MGSSDVKMGLFYIFLIWLFFISVGFPNNFLDLCPEVINLLKRSVMCIGNSPLLGVCAHIVLRLVRLGQIILGTVVVRLILTQQHWHLILQQVGLHLLDRSFVLHVATGQVHLQILHQLLSYSNKLLYFKASFKQPFQQHHRMAKQALAWVGLKVIIKTRLQIMGTNEEKLSKIFTESFQVKRLAKQIQDLKELRQKGTFDIRMSLLKNQCLIFKVEVAASAFKNTKIPDHLKVPQDFKLVIRNTYPASPPRLFFMSDNMCKFGLKPFRDYMSELLSTLGEWSAKITSQQIIKAVPNFLEQCHLNKAIIANKFPAIQQYFQVDNLFSWKFSQTYPIRLIKRTSNKPGFLFIDVFSSEIVFLKDVGIEASFAICDFVKGEQIQSLRKKKNTSNVFMLEVKLNYPGISGKYGIEFSSQDSQNILIAIMDCVKISENQRKNSEGETKNAEDSSSSEEQKEEVSKNQKKAKARPISQNARIEQVLEEILIVQSLVDNKMTSENLSQLVSLLQRAIEYYSANGDKRFNIYLTKMQAILSNEMAQALLESANEQKKKSKQAGQSLHTHKEEQYESIVDLI